MLTGSRMPTSSRVPTGYRVPTKCITPRKNKNPTQPTGSRKPTGSRMPSGSSGSRLSGWLGGRGSTLHAAACCVLEQVPLKKIIPSRSYRNKA